MSLVMSQQQNSASFALQSRLFVSMKRAGRVVDLVWFQQSVEYARAVLAAADNMPDVEVREISARLRELLRDYLGQGKVAVLPVSRPVPVATDAEPATEADSADPDRYITTLR